MKSEADEGRRIKLELFGENYYLSVFPEDGGWAFLPTVPRENDPRMSRERLAVETICRVLGEATRGGDEEERIVSCRELAAYPVHGHGTAGHWTMGEV